MRSQTWPSRSSQPSGGLEGTTGNNAGQPAVRPEGRLRLCTVAAQDTAPPEQCSGGNARLPQEA